uniref:Putative CO dehydrogenase subunit n=1 Tax=Amycolatopsis sp. SANK 60206 TaxID=1642649 RepID=A0A0E3Z7I2_9PSEU|nr:putative CO dehydrogenase subunit [Amycolatopsis sp. SANK 60206]
MTSSAFDYARPDGVGGAVRMLAGNDGTTRVLAGGQSLLPMLRLRRISPRLVVDVGRVPELRGVTEETGSLLIGTMTTHHEVLHDPLIRRYAPLLSQATATVGDPAVRHRGTLGGAIAHADPAGDMPVTVLALDGELVAEGPRGRRSIPAAEFFTGCLSSALELDELLVGIRLPKRHDDWAYHYEKFRPSAQAPTTVAVAVAVRCDAGHIAEAGIGLANVAATPVRASATEAALAGAVVSTESVARAAAAAAENVSPLSATSAPADYLAHLTRVLTHRAVLIAARPIPRR